MIEKIYTGVINKLLQEILKSAKGPLKQAIASCLTDKAQELRDRYAQDIINVKTIWQIDKAVSVNEFYYPTTLEFASSSKIANDVSIIFQERRSIVIEGIAGQGKSIFLRHLCTKCFSGSDVIPVFLQLRFISKENKISDLVKQQLDALGIVDDPFVYEYFFRQGKVVFLFDGFDEIDIEYRQQTIKEIEEFIHKYKNTRTIISSRPNSDIQHSNLFNIIKIKPLNHIDRDKLIEKLVDDKTTKSMITNSLKDKNKVSDVLTTPLLVTLLVITYKSENEIPDHLSDFYKALFITLVKRHDKTKPGFIRQRNSKFGNFEFEKLFENLSFIALNNYKTSMTEREFCEFSKEAMTAEGYSNTNPHLLIDDIVQVTCLVVLDGHKYYFLHKSIPEYFAAQKIAEEKDETIKVSFYEQMLNNKIPENWYQTLFFLSEIDEYFFNEKFLIPYYAKTFGVQLDNLPENAPDFTRESFISMIGHEAEIDIFKYGNEFRTAFLGSSNNWLVNTYLHNKIEIALNRYVTRVASEHTLDKLSEINKDSSSLVYCFDRTKEWGPFLSFINIQSDIRHSYKDIFALRKKIIEHKRLTSPLLNIKFGN